MPLAAASAAQFRHFRSPYVAMALRLKSGILPIALLLMAIAIMLPHPDQFCSRRIESILKSRMNECFALIISYISIVNLVYNIRCLWAKRKVAPTKAFGLHLTRGRDGPSGEAPKAISRRRVGLCGGSGLQGTGLAEPQEVQRLVPWSCHQPFKYIQYMATYIQHTCTSKH